MLGHRPSDVLYVVTHVIYKSTPYQSINQSISPLLHNEPKYGVHMYVCQVLLLMPSSAYVYAYAYAYA